MIGRDEFAAWFRLLESPGIGRQSARRLLAAFGSPEEVLAAPVSARERVVGATAARALAEPPPEVSERLEAGWRWLHSGGNEERDAIVLGDSRYPALLLETGDPPLLLYTRGNAGLLQAASIAIVGSRSPTAQGLDNARAFAASLGGAGYAIVSGLALGIDGAAHQGALDAGAATIAVVGTGLDRVYPARHKALAQRIVERGLIISEFPVGMEALQANFPVRNRLIAGLALGTLVVEAAVQSGSLITARMALESGRDVFAIPGSIHSPQSRGCHALIKQGAKLADGAADILDDLAPTRAGRTAKTASAAVDKTEGDDSTDTDTWLLRALGFDPVRLDELVARTGRSAAELNARLLELEFAGRVARLPGQAFQRIGRAWSAQRFFTAPFIRVCRRAGKPCGIVNSCSMSSCTCTRTTGAPTPAPRTSS